jgi:hypothetical protein
MRRGWVAVVVILLGAFVGFLIYLVFVGDALTRRGVWS